MKKPILKVDRKAFIDYILDDENGTNLNDVAKILKKKGRVTAEDLLKNCSLLTNDLIKNKVSKKLRVDEDIYGFEVYHEYFTIKFVG
jgi:hypothetical protein